MTFTSGLDVGVDLSAEEFWEQSQEDRAAAFATLRAKAPLAFYEEPELPMFPKGPGYFAVTTHADVEYMSATPDLFCSGQGATSILDLPMEMQEFYGSMISMDNPRHAKIRRIVSSAFTPKMLEEVIDDVDLVSKEILAAARKTAEANNGEFDLVREVAAPLPLRIICRMMGIPEEDEAMVLQQSNIILSGGDPDYIATPEEGMGMVLTAGQLLSDLMLRLGEERREKPTEDLTSALIHAEIDGETLTGQEIASFFILLCVAGNETTRTATSHGVYELDRRPEQRKAWMADESLTKTAVEEIVRFASPVTWMRRTATRDVTIRDQVYPEASKFILFYNSANRDESVFKDPDTFDISRSPNPHVGFGARGPHFCLGANLARRELAVAFRNMFAEMPNLKVVGEPDRLRSSFINGIKRMTVSLGE
ncbi:MAG TPA: cytochrome P450 [Mycobacteriales bacterium]|jgi:cytochrome P450|nr:cytochrome P450 [Mycobacteriales bacterium]